MGTVEVTLTVPALEHDRFVAMLEERASGFLQTDAELVAYVSADRWSEALREQLAARLRADGYGDALTARLLSDRNWNAVWEASIAPVRVGPFLLCGRSTDVPPDHADATVLRLDPKMSFGTGHHATTRLALRLLTGTVESDDTVVDVGTGTGVLAIGACRLGARTALAIDTSPKAVANTRENVAVNDADDCVTVRAGSIDAVAAPVDVVVANITRDTLLDLLPDFRSRLAPDGTLLLSGLLTSDRDRMVGALDDVQLKPDEEVTENGWWAVRAHPHDRGDA